ncbi:MAG: hypothetical protein QG654_64 [Patescibacteria group bacterium]|jgi:hypothetical protein|nr:hypothetical protein [Patescibacteria group bacterium]
MWGILLYNKRVKKTLITIELFLTLLVVVLFAFLLFIFTNSKVKDEPILPSVSVDTSELYCGISITSPEIGSSVYFPIEVSGYVSGCGWDPYLNYVAKMKIYDSEKRLIGRPYLVNKSTSSNSPVSTQFKIVINDLPIKEGPVEFVFENFGILEKTMTVPLNIISKPVEQSE